jgi:hypothetical protein
LLHSFFLLFPFYNQSADFFFLRNILTINLQTYA